MSAPLNTIVESGGDFVTREAAGGTIASGATGTILTLTPLAGQRVRLTHLSTASPVIQINITVRFDAIDLVTAKSVQGDSPQAPAEFSIGSYQPYTAGLPPSGNHKHITGKIDEVLYIILTTSTITVDLYYAYEFGE